MKVEGISALVTGGASGLGLATVRRLLADGASSVVIADLPFLSYRKGLKEAMDAVHDLMSVGANAVKLEGVRGHAEIVRHIVDSGVPVMGHLGLTPQSLHGLGGMKIQARTNAAVKILASEARELEDAGCFALVLECVPAEAARQVTKLLKIPTIGIGAGPGVSGQVLVYQDMIGLNPGFKPKFLRTYANVFDIIQIALNAYDRDVKSGSFPNDSESYSQIHQLNRGAA